MKVSSIPFDMNEVSSMSEAYQISPEFSQFNMAATALSDIASGRDAIFVVSTGQENAYGANTDGALPEEFETNDNVHAWDANAQAFVVSGPEKYQSGTDYTAASVSPTHAFCVRLQKETGKGVYYVQLGYMLKSIVNWTGDTSDPSIFNWDIGRYLMYQTGLAAQSLSQFGVVAPDVITFFQGESDAERNVDWYAAQFGSMLQRFADYGLYYHGITPFICGEPLESSGARKLREFYRSMHRFGVNGATTASTDGLERDASSPDIMNGKSCWRFGYERMFHALLHDVSTRSRIVMCDSSNIPPAQIVPRGMLLHVNDQTQPYIAVSDGASLKKVNIA